MIANHFCYHINMLTDTQLVCFYHVASAPFESTSQFGNPNILVVKIFGFPN